MNIQLVIHTENIEKFNQLIDLIDKNKNKFSLFLNSKNYVPWSNEKLKNKIISFRKYFAFPTSKNKVESIVELLSYCEEEKILIIDENCQSIPIKEWEYRFDSILINKSDLKNLNLDTKYESIKWFLIDLYGQKFGYKNIEDDGSKDTKRFLKKIESPFFREKIIYIDGGMGDHVMAFPLIEKLSTNIYVSCKYPHLLEHIPLKGFIDWNDELFGGYKKFVYEYGSKHNSKTIVDAFFEMYGEKRLETDILKYNGDKIYSNEIPKEKKIAIICTSAAKINGQDSNKDWSDIRWFKLVHELKKMNYYVVQVGAKNDNQIPNVDYKFLNKSISELAGLIDESSLWITVDTFFHHFASAIKPENGICLTPYYNDHAKHYGVKYIEKDCGKNFSDRKWWLDLQQPERKECMSLIKVEDVLKNITTKKRIITYSNGRNDNCSNWRIFQQYEGFDDFEIIHKTGLGPISEEEMNCNIAILSRPVTNCLQHILNLKKLGIKIIVDYDDAFPYVDYGHPIFIDSFIEVLKIIKECDLITTTNDRLKYFFSLYTNTKCVVFPNIINPSLINERKTNNENKIILGWYGSVVHYESLKLINNVVLKILDEFDNVYLNIYSESQKVFDLFKHEKTNFIPYNFTFSEFQNSLGDIDVNLAPFVENYINLHKSNIRIILAGYKGIPSIASNFGEYKLLGGENVILCDNLHDWYNNLKKLITDKNFYIKYSKNIKNKIDSELTFDKSYENKKNILNKLIDGKL